MVTSRLIGKIGGAEVEATETVDVSIVENRTGGGTTFTGTVWWTPLN